MIIIKLFHGVVFTSRSDAGERGQGWERRQGAVSLRFEPSLQFMTRVGLRGTSRVKGG